MWRLPTLCRFGHFGKYRRGGIGHQVPVTGYGGNHYGAISSRYAGRRDKFARHRLDFPATALL
ncbi:hypothetical protein Z949_1295 [Sulfitobacter guttiformis KCTC 32187]|nr:hypothetical protein Z949_1295 [Sulfitobacter guttiformis KCTC 32187]